MRRRTLKFSGFTLIEILIVMLIISIVSGVAVLSIGHNESKRIETFAKDFSQLLMLAEEQAMLRPMVIGVSIESHRFRFLEWVELKGQKSQWQLIEDDDLLKVHAIPDGVSVSLRSSRPEKRGSGEVPDVVISTNGSLTPFSLLIGKEEEKPLYVVTGTADGQITAEPLP